ncbi:hypothetical protein IGB42_02493 [Andreprevotia sp. IGB-42]|uniref:SphA family protein n=1 Tax=Andreprevotia sp. IGB-42 TaxID=2497473 RepID=UPI00135C720F|nr:transporter [Andreprevotia sp. IGB-42]KAF0813093.1 hypothetical protein IGB42_02493 [Andreprevotia sp. IGB-42]
MHKKYRLPALLAGSLLATLACAEEGGTGHYMPGSMSSFIDSVPPAPTFLMRLNALHYGGDMGKNIKVPIAGNIVADADVDIDGLGLTMVWRPDITLPENWSYAMGGTIPVIKVDVHARGTAAALNGQPGRELSDSDSGLGDIMLMPLMVAYQVSPDFSSNFRISAYAPTGRYTEGKLANTGKNYWSFEPTLGLMYFGKQNGIEASLFSGITFNTRNKDSDYQTGTQIHFDGTVAQHFPLWGGLAGAGLSAYYYKQVEGDSGSGATLGDFKAKTIGYGPALSYVGKYQSHTISAELKWLHENDTDNRLKGDTLFFKLLSNF